MTPSTLEIYVSPDGRDTWSGTIPIANADETDGPLGTIAEARENIHRRKLEGRLPGSVIVRLRGGKHHLTKPVTFTADDSAPVTFTPYEGEQASISGGRKIEGWREETRDGRVVWVTELPEVASGNEYYQQFFVNGQRRNRPRVPREGFYKMVGGDTPKDVGGMFTGSNTFTCATGDIQNWQNLNDIEAVVLHYWIEERMPLESFDPESCTVVSSRTTRMSLADGHEGPSKYYVDNVKEAFGEPGDWYLDRPTGELTYIPLSGEELSTIEAYVPVAKQLIRLVGEPENGRYVEFLRFDGLQFEHTAWDLPTDGSAGWSQSANGVSGALYFEGARGCSVENCTVSHIGGYGIEVGLGCNGIRVVGNEITDLGAGGVKIAGANAHSSVALRTGDIRLTDNHIHDGGKVAHSGVGVLSMDAYGNTISHNHIHDFYYTGISCGWVWGYRENVSHDNMIENNHIHDLGKGWLSDMGGIYTLGVQPGTTLRGNVIHDVVMAGYGGWAIYPDEGSSHMLIENNIGYRTSGQAFHQHYGRENIVRNNIWAFGDESGIRTSRIESHKSIMFFRNIVITDGKPIYHADSGLPNFTADLNLFWDISGEDVKMIMNHEEDEWLGTGNDLNSLVGDPMCADPRSGDFTLADDSPALALGFIPFDTSDVGPRPEGQRD
jgi:hypothetical protein